jgi:uncharacterized protein (DUF4415 family)
MTDRKRTLAEERAHNDMMIELDRTRRWLDQAKLRWSLIPDDWHEVEKRVPVRPKKSKITAAFDDDMLRWYRAMGHGYQGRMNAILRTFMLATIAKEVRLRKDRNWMGGPIEDRHGMRPKGA